MLPVPGSTTHQPSKPVDLLERLGITPRGLPNARAYRKVIMRDPCAYCGGDGGQCDHIVPRASVGGNTGTSISITELDNLTAGCASCNRAKGNTSLLLFLAERCGAARVRRQLALF